jgi:hypothetical protein
VPHGEDEAWPSRASELGKRGRPDNPTESVTALSAFEPGCANTALLGPSVHPNAELIDSGTGPDRDCGETILVAMPTIEVKGIGPK